MSPRIPRPANFPYKVTDRLTISSSSRDRGSNSPSASMSASFWPRICFIKLLRDTPTVYRQEAREAFEPVHRDLTK
ncbi:uncharacterized protein ARMOST_02484 [Armillaria ostoyae]|uniref:Uncharacterized protein n=1 Tax=Armillaria ostoyae TaxID=47428 RepID=A0A284QRT9_ARMOS|nr:uncharacterized protein ARMOST_02484 [Armillaria ostoyae]